jgi:hypothetical protein
MFKALFVSYFSPEVKTTDVEKSPERQLGLNLVCTRLRTKFRSHAYFHALVNDNDFPLINNTGAWTNG